MTLVMVVLIPLEVCEREPEMRSMTSAREIPEVNVRGLVFSRRVIRASRDDVSCVRICLITVGVVAGISILAGCVGVGVVGVVVTEGSGKVKRLKYDESHEPIEAKGLIPRVNPLRKESEVEVTAEAVIEVKSCACTGTTKHT